MEYIHEGNCLILRSDASSKKKKKWQGTIGIITGSSTEEELLIAEECRCVADHLGMYLLLMNQCPSVLSLSLILESCNLDRLLCLQNKEYQGRVY